MLLSTRGSPGFEGHRSKGQGQKSGRPCPPHPTGSGSRASSPRSGGPALGAALRWGIKTVIRLRRIVKGPPVSLRSSGHAWGLTIDKTREEWEKVLSLGRPVAGLALQCSSKISQLCSHSVFRLFRPYGVPLLVDLERQIDKYGAGELEGSSRLLNNLSTRGIGAALLERMIVIPKGIKAISRGLKAVRPIPPERHEKEGDDPVRGRRSRVGEGWAKA
jgi:hypothetical protein